MIEGLYEEFLSFNLKEFITYVDKNRSIILHGSFTDSIPYYQLIIPINNSMGIDNLIAKSHRNS